MLTFEELMGMFQAKGINFAEVEPGEPFTDSTAAGRGFAVGGGVAQAVADCIKQIDPDREVKVQSAQGLHDCKRMLMLAKAGKYDGYLLEGMDARRLRSRRRHPAAHRQGFGQRKAVYEQGRAQDRLRKPIQHRIG